MDDARRTPRALVAGHGDFAAGVVSAVAQITGRGEQFLTLSNRDGSREELEQRIEGLMDDHGVRVVFTDLAAGSCTIAARKVQRRRPELLVVAGTNLATLLDFACHVELAPVECARHAVEKGSAAPLVIGGEGGDAA